MVDTWLIQPWKGREKHGLVLHFDRIGNIRETDPLLKNVVHRVGSDELAPRIHALTTRKAELECARNEAIAALRANKLGIDDIE